MKYKDEIKYAITIIGGITCFLLVVWLACSFVTLDPNVMNLEVFLGFMRFGIASGMIIAFLELASKT